MAVMYLTVFERQNKLLVLIFFFFTRQKFKVLIAWSLVLYWVFALGNFHNAVPYLSSQYPTLVLVLPYV